MKVAVQDLRQRALEGHPPGDDLAITTSPVHGAIVTVRAEPLGRRLRRLVPGLVCVAGAYGLHRATAVTHIGQLRVLAWTSAALGVVWLARAVAAASTRAIEIRVNHDTLTLRRVRALGSTARRVPIERVEAVERRRRAPRAGCRSRTSPIRSRDRGPINRARHLKIKPRQRRMRSASGRCERRREEPPRRKKKARGAVGECVA